MNPTLHSSGSTGAMKPTRTYGTSSVGTSLSTCGSSTRMLKQANSSSSRPLPHGPGPLPNKLSIPDKSGTRTSSTKFVAAPVGHFSHQKSYGKDSSAARRKTSIDSGYASSSRTSYAYGDLRSGKSKSLSQLNSHRDEISDLLRSPSNRRRMESSVHGASSRTGHSYTQNHVGTKATLNGGSNTKSSSTSIYRSTTHLDYKDPKEERKSLHYGGQSYSSHKDLSNAHTTSGKDNYSVRDVDKTRKATITALPGSDMKCARNSSISSLNSSSSNSVSICSRKLGKVQLIWQGGTAEISSFEFQYLHPPPPPPCHIKWTFP